MQLQMLMASMPALDHNSSSHQSPQKRKLFQLHSTVANPGDRRKINVGNSMGSVMGAVHVYRKYAMCLQGISEAQGGAALRYAVVQGVTDSLVSTVTWMSSLQR